MHLLKYCTHISFFGNDITQNDITPKTEIIFKLITNSSK